LGLITAHEASAPAEPADCAALSGDALSQEEIDRLLADFGK
jgi:hypothetical protein